MRLNRPKPPRALISLVSMIDVLMIMLVFFMVTSTYLNLNMLPMAERADAPVAAPAVAGPGTAPLLIRLAPDGLPHVRGATLGTAALTALLHDRLAADPQASVIVLPSGHADVQALVSLMDAVTRAGVTRLRIVRLEGQR